MWKTTKRIKETDYEHSVAKASELDSDVSNNVQYTHSLALQRESVVTYICWAITDRLAQSL